MRFWPVFSTLCITAILVLALKNSALQELETEALPVLGHAPEFELQDEKGETFHSKSLTGKPWVVSFFFTSCPHVCPAIQGRFKRLRSEFRSEDLNFVSLSIDPVTDTPGELQKFRSRLADQSENWILLTHMATDEQADSKAFVASIIEQGFKLPADAGLPHHTARFVLVDSRQQILGYFDGNSDSGLDQLGQALRQLLE